MRTVLEVPKMKNVYILTEKGNSYNDAGCDFITERIRTSYKDDSKLTFDSGVTAGTEIVVCYKRKIQADFALHLFPIRGAETAQADGASPDEEGLSAGGDDFHLPAVPGSRLHSLRIGEEHRRPPAFRIRRDDRGPPCQKERPDEGRAGGFDVQNLPLAALRSVLAESGFRDPRGDPVPGHGSRGLTRRDEDVPDPRPGELRIRDEESESPPAVGEGPAHRGNPVVRGVEPLPARGGGLSAPPFGQIKGPGLSGASDGSSASRRFFQRGIFLFPEGTLRLPDGFFSFLCVFSRHGGPFCIPRKKRNRVWLRFRSESY